jgi:hypothetical protein
MKFNIWDFYKNLSTIHCWLRLNKKCRSLTQRCNYVCYLSMIGLYKQVSVLCEILAEAKEKVDCLNITRRAMYVWHNIEVHSCKHCCSEKAISITYSVCVCGLKYPACSAHVPHCRLWPARLYIIFPSSLINGMIFKKKVIENNICGLILLKIKCVFWFSV